MVISAIVVFKVILLMVWTKHYSHGKSEEIILVVQNGVTQINNNESSTSVVSMIESKNITDAVINYTNISSEEVVTVSSQHSVFLEDNIDETFVSVKYADELDCDEVVGEEQESTNKIFAVISGFDLSNQMILSTESEAYFILVGQENEISDSKLLKQTFEERLNLNNESNFQIIFCSDHMDTNFNKTISRISSLLQNKLRSFKAIIILDIESQQILWPGISKVLQGNHIARKNLGYLMGIALGAEFIVDLDGSHILTHPEFLRRKGLTAIKSNSNHPVIASLHSNVNNPYVLMGPRIRPDEKLDSANAMNNIWPRGYPTSELKYKEVPTFHLLEELETRLTEQSSTKQKCFRFSNDIIQSLEDERPDVDSEYESSLPLHVTFTPQSHRLSIHPSQFAPFNAQATIFSRHAFWALLLPGSVGDAVSDIWRGYIAQTFLHCTGSLLAFSAPIVKQVKDKNSNTKLSQKDTRLYSQIKDLIEFLSVYDCIQSSPKVSNGELTESLPHCMIVLYSKLVSRGFLEGEKDISLIRGWIRALISLDYFFPNFYPNRECKAKRDSLYRPNWDFAEHSFCNVSQNTTTAPSGRRDCGRSLLTVVHINFGHKEVIPVWLAQWQYVYPDPIFYISDRKESRNSGSCLLEPTDYFDISCDVKDELGRVAYESLILAMARYPDYDNYMFIHDDAYISHKTLEKVIDDRVSAICNTLLADGAINWSWNPMVQKSMQKLVIQNEFQPKSIYRESTEKYCPELYEDESKFSEGSFSYYLNMADIFILKSSDVEAFLVIINKYFEVDMFLEVAVPMTFRCALNAREIPRVTYWDGRRGNIDHNRGEICGTNPPQILHPIWKLSIKQTNPEEWFRQLKLFVTVRYCEIA